MELETDRLLLNSFRKEDAELVAELAGDKRVVEITDKDFIEFCVFYDEKLLRKNEYPF